MTKRLNGKGDPSKYPRDPHDWYREPRFTPRQIMDCLDLGDPATTMIVDPCCGKGNMLDEAKARGYATFGMDIVDRHPAHNFKRGNFMQIDIPDFATRPKLSIFTNPPYNVPKGIALAIIQKVLREVDFERAVFVLPIEFTCGQDRYWDLYRRTPPSHVLFCSQRPSMPPGAAVEDMGEAAFKGGMADYVVLCWTKGGPYRTECRWLKPDDATAPPEYIGRRVR